MDIYKISLSSVEPIKIALMSSDEEHFDNSKLLTLAMSSDRYNENTCASFEYAEYVEGRGDGGKCHVAERR